MPRDVTPDDVERALALSPDAWLWGPDWDDQDRAEMRDALAADDLATAISIRLPCGDLPSRLHLAALRWAHSEGWPEEVTA